MANSEENDTPGKSSLTLKASLQYIEQHKPVKNSAQVSESKTEDSLSLSRSVSR